MNTLSQRVKAVLSDMEGPETGKQVRLAAIAGCARGRVSQWLNDPSDKMSYKHAKEISDELGYSADWLMNGNEPTKSRNGTNGASVKYQLVWVTLDEIELLTAYRETDAGGKNYIRKSADLQEKVKTLDYPALPNKA